MLSSPHVSTLTAKLAQFVFSFRVTRVNLGLAGGGDNYTSPVSDGRFSADVNRS